ncbi:hypothetical protein KC356_g116 [Hortaea werneckii]|nr:hypothetical protein KC356_g116 [Hortaea werneckii]
MKQHEGECCRRYGLLESIVVVASPRRTTSARSFRTMIVSNILLEEKGADGLRTLVSMQPWTGVAIFALLKCRYSRKSLKFHVSK